MGITVITGRSIVAYHSEDQAVLDAVELSDGRNIPTRMALSTIGVRPTIDVVEDRGIDVDEDLGAILVNEQLQTNIPNIYAAGGVASLNGYIAHTSEQAVEQGRIAALNILGQDATYTVHHLDLDTTLYDLPFAYFGEASDKTWIWEADKYGYACVFLSNGRIQGAQLLGKSVAWSERLL
jgi:nitrite reductase (NADH) large subunit